MAALQHASLQWLAHLLLGSAAILLGPWPALGWVTLALHATLQVLAQRWLEADVRAGLVSRPLSVAALAHGPGLLLALTLLLMFLGVLASRPMLMVHLQWWTAMWSPPLALLPAGARRNLYVWVTLCIPLLEWLWLTRGGGVARREAAVVA